MEKVELFKRLGAIIENKDNPIEHRAEAIRKIGKLFGTKIYKRNVRRR